MKFLFFLCLVASVAFTVLIVKRGDKTKSIAVKGPETPIPTPAPEPSPIFKGKISPKAAKLGIGRPPKLGAKRQGSTRRYPEGLDWKKIDTFKEVDGGIEIVYEIKEGRPTVQGDILLPSKTGQEPKDGKFVMSRPEIWKGGEVPYKIQTGLPNKEEVLKAIDYLNNVSVIRFIPHEGQEDYVVFEQGNDHCYSHLGRIGGEQKVMLSPKCTSAEILHELLHTLGFFHEHSREDRDQYITVYWGNIEEKYWDQFKRIPKKYQLEYDLEFDTKSVMMYRSNAFAKNPDYATISTIEGEIYQPNYGELSDLDLEKISLVYGGENEN